MRNFLDQIGGLWAKGALIGKVGSVFTSRCQGWRAAEIARRLATGNRYPTTSC